MPKNKNKTQKPLTLDALATYNQEVLFPAMEERFVTKKEFKSLETEISGLKIDTKSINKKVGNLATEFKSFKNETLTNQDAMLKKLDILLTEKKVREYQENKEKKLWAIIIKALKEHRILSSKELKEIAQLEIF